VTTITVSFDRGPNAGSYTVSADPACSYGVIAKGTWAMQYGNFGAGPNDLSTVQLQISPDSSGKAGTDYIVSAFIVVGAIVGGTDYTLSLDRFTHGVNKVDVVDQGGSAEIHVSGASTQTPLGPGGVLIDIGVFCPSVNRG
jgi:hypothetical protein